MTQKTPPAAFRGGRLLDVVKNQAPIFYPLFQKVLAGKGSRSQCIKAQCLDCQGLQKELVKECGDRCCPLWFVRPFSKKTKPLTV